MEIVTRSAAQTKKIAEIFAREAFGTLRQGGLAHALVISLAGNLGSGKTTFAQGFARGLGVKGRVLSPTFVLLKKYHIAGRKNFFHIDCYRLKRAQDIEVIGFGDIVHDTHAIVLIEWGDRMRRLLPKHRLTIRLSHGRAHTRRIVLSSSFKHSIETVE